MPALNVVSNDAIFGAVRRHPMRSTINIDDRLMEKARSLTGIKETAAIVRQALETLVRVEAGKRLIVLGGTMPEAEAAPRRRSEAAK
jgi:Arc/MetJ family transcription regulator